MRKITETAVKKFHNNDNFKKDNTEVWYGRECEIGIGMPKGINNKKLFEEWNINGIYNKLTPITKLYLYGNLIAYKKYSSLVISNCGWFSKTTKERLNGLLDSIGFNGIYQKKFEWFLADKKWNGNPVKILKNNEWEYI